MRADRIGTFLDWRIAASEVSGADVVFRWKIKPSASEMWRNTQRVMLRARLPNGARRTQPLTIRLTFIPPVWTCTPLSLSLWTIGPSDPWKVDAPLPDAELEPGELVRLACGPGPVECLRVDCRPMADGGKVRALIAPQDRFGNPARFAKPVPITLRWRGTSQELVIQEGRLLELPAADAIARAEASLPLSALGAEENIANGTIAGDQVCVVGNPVWPAPVAGLTPAFGEFHWHTDCSADGQRAIADALRSARDDLNLDFAAPGDHDTSGERWARTVAALEAAHQPPAFMTFFGWESGSLRGHENYYFTRPDHPLICGGSAGHNGGTPEEHTDLLRRYDGFIAVPHHTNAVAESRRLEDDAPYWHPYAWSEPTPAHRLIEIMQCRGNQEREDYTDAWRGWHQRNGASVQEALARGYRLGFTGGTDNHQGWPGRAFADECLGHYPPTSQILTGVWIAARERQPLFDALYARHTWAVWGTRAIVWFALNGAMMGEEIRVPRGAPLTATLRLSAESPVQTVEIVNEGRVVWQSSFHQLDIEAEIPLGKAAGSTHFYLRALLRNGGIIYASPVFVDVEDA